MLGNLYLYANTEEGEATNSVWILAVVSTAFITLSLFLEIANMIAIYFHRNAAGAEADKQVKRQVSIVGKQQSTRSLGEDEEGRASPTNDMENGGVVGEMMQMNGGSGDDDQLYRRGGGEGGSEKWGSKKKFGLNMMENPLNIEDGRGGLFE